MDTERNSILEFHSLRVLWLLKPKRGINMKNVSFLILIMILFSGCTSLPFKLPGVSSPSTATPAPQPIVVETETQVKLTSTPTSVPRPKNDPSKAITIFLDGQKAGTPFALTSNLLSSSLASSVKDDPALKVLLGSQAHISDFKISSPSYTQDLQKSSVEATVYMPQSSNLRFSMLIENGEWKIEEIKVLSGIDEYPTTPEGVVHSFLITYQEAPDRMSNFLTATRRSAQPPGGASSMLQISGSLEGLVIQSAAVNPEPPSAAIKVMIRAGGKDYSRNFLLTKENANWGIDAIEINGN